MTGTLEGLVGRQCCPNQLGPGRLTSHLRKRWRRSRKVRSCRLPVGVVEGGVLPGMCERVIGLILSPSTFSSVFSNLAVNGYPKPTLFV